VSQPVLAPEQTGHRDDDRREENARHEDTPDEHSRHEFPVVEVQFTIADGARRPAAAHAWDAGYDLTAAEHAELLPAGGRQLVGTGIRIALPDGYAALVLPRSGLAAKHGVTVINAPGLIDAGYRGEVRVAMVNHDPHEPYAISPGDRIAQLVVIPVTTVSWREVTSLPPSERGTGGFGSSGRR
jgi:dUTP pyrophosphatase